MGHVGMEFWDRPWTDFEPTLCRLWAGADFGPTARLCRTFCPTLNGIRARLWANSGPTLNRFLKAANMGMGDFSTILTWVRVTGGTTPSCTNMGRVTCQVGSCRSSPHGFTPGDPQPLARAPRDEIGVRDLVARGYSIPGCVSQRGVGRPAA